MVLIISILAIVFAIVAALLLILSIFINKWKLAAINIAIVFINIAIVIVLHHRF